MAAPRDLEISPRRRLPARLLTPRFSRAGGPGGQNVNKVATKVDLRLDLDGAAEVLGDAAVRRLRTRLATRIGSDGQLRVVASRHRERGRNLEAACTRMEELLREALAPRRARRATRPTRASRERRVSDKRHRGRIKRSRRERDDD